MGQCGHCADHGWTIVCGLCMTELCYQCSALQIVGAESIPAEKAKKILSMCQDNDIPVMCQTCAIITTARAEADGLSLTWGLYTWLPNPEQRTAEPSLSRTAQENRNMDTNV
jgi:hypothetical protein